jgi:hypothetical protein
MGEAWNTNRVENKDTNITPDSPLLYWAFYDVTAGSSRGNLGINREGGSVPWRKTTTPGFSRCPFLSESSLSSPSLSPRLKRGCRQKKLEQFHAAGSRGNKKRDSKLGLLLETGSRYSLYTLWYSVYPSSIHWGLYFLTIYITRLQRPTKK